MIRVTPYRIPFYSKQDTRKSGNFTFEATQVVNNNPNPIDFSVLTAPVKALLWIKDGNLLTAINHLENLRFDQEDVQHVQSMGVVLPFLSGSDAVKFIKDSNIRVKFAQLSSSNIHAQYDFDSNYILINNLYKNTKNPAEILAISEAILHEAGHAKDQDGVSTIQEEIDCLALNALSHRVLSKKYPHIFDGQSSLIIKEGVCVYANLFFDEDPLKAKLNQRLKLKYGQLPVGDLKHPPSGLAFRVKN